MSDYHQLRSINLNDKVWVKLSQAGDRRWAEYYSLLGGPPLTNAKDKNGYLCLQLWELIQIFGSQIRMGSKDLPFEDMTLYLEEPNA